MTLQEPLGQRFHDASAKPRSIAEPQNFTEYLKPFNFLITRCMFRRRHHDLQTLLPTYGKCSDGMLRCGPSLFKCVVLSTTVKHVNNMPINTDQN